MDSETARIEHLKAIKDVIARMSRNSFAVKAGSLTIVAGLLAITLSINSSKLAAIGMIPIITLWCLDAFYVRQERMFRRLYDSVRIGQAPEIGSPGYFSMNTQLFQSDENGLISTIFSKTLPLFYVPLLGTLIAVAVMTWGTY
jgi:hypothetical protein